MSWLPIGWTDFLKKLWRTPPPFPPIFAEGLQNQSSGEADAAGANSAPS